MAKADLRKAETDWRAQIGQAIQVAVARRGWSLKEFAALRHLIVVALSELLSEVTVETVIRMRRQGR